MTIEIDDGTEDNYNRSFVGYAPEGLALLQNLQPQGFP
jgi:hypothetical protein